MFRGSIVALVTPMTTEGELDLKALGKLIEMHLHAGTDGIVAVASTGEGTTLTNLEKYQVVKKIIEIVNNKIPIIAASNANGTKETIELTKAMMELGVDGCLLATPAYVRPTQWGLIQHFTAIALAVPLPIILYNVPKRTGCDILPETVIELAKLPNIVGLKDASGIIERIKILRQNCGDRFEIFSGIDSINYELMQLGAKGTITVTGNIAPVLLKKMCDAVFSHNEKSAFEIAQKLAPLDEALSVESNPIPVKWALHKLNLIDNGIRLPLTPLIKEHEQVVEDAMKSAEII